MQQEEIHYRCCSGPRYASETIEFTKLKNQQKLLLQDNASS